MSVGVAADRCLLAPDHRRLHGGDDVVDLSFGDAHDAEVVGDPDRTDLATLESALVGDRPDEVARPHAALAAQADIEVAGRPVCLTAPFVTLHAALLLTPVTLLRSSVLTLVPLRRVGDLHVVDA